MMTDTDARLAAIKAKAEKSGFDFKEASQLDAEIFVMSINQACELRFAKGYKGGYRLAEALLAALDPDAVRVTPVGGECRHCVLWSPHEWQPHPGDCAIGAGKHDDYEKRIDDCVLVPGPDCPGSAPDGMEWVLVLREKVER
jgi:hypothetical protein